jgi:hypothetical protein
VASWRHNQKELLGINKHFVGVHLMVERAPSVFLGVVRKFWFESFIFIKILRGLFVSYSSKSNKKLKIVI